MDFNKYKKNMNILILCTGNSCRSQMAHGILQSLNIALNVHSAGTHPADNVNPNAIKVLAELGLDISHHKPMLVETYLDKSWDFVITVCGGAHESCPSFLGQVKNRIHIGFEDPADAIGTPEEILDEFRTIRNQILIAFFSFYHHRLKK
jgi:arsenate reductase